MLWVETRRIYALLELNNGRKPQRSVSESFFLCSVTRCVLATCFSSVTLSLLMAFLTFSFVWIFNNFQLVFICFLVLSFCNNVFTSVLHSFIWKYLRILSPILFLFTCEAKFSFPFRLKSWNTCGLNKNECLVYMTGLPDMLAAISHRHPFWAGFALHHLVPYWIAKTNIYLFTCS